MFTWDAGQPAWPRAHLKLPRSRLAEMEISHVNTCRWASPVNWDEIVRTAHVSSACEARKASWLGCRTPMWRRAVKQLGQVSQPALPSQPAPCEKALKSFSHLTFCHPSILTFDAPNFRELFHSPSPLILISYQGNPGRLYVVYTLAVAWSVKSITLELAFCNNFMLISCFWL